MMRHVISEVTPLAHRLEVVVGAVLRVVIEMRDGQHDTPLRPPSGLSLTFFAAPWTWMGPVESALA